VDPAAGAHDMGSGLVVISIAGEGQRWDGRKITEGIEWRGLDRALRLGV
jgi:hypothetical protein